jgi:hypothetical protein
MRKLTGILGATFLTAFLASACVPGTPSAGMNQATAHILTLYAVLTNSAPNQNTTPTNPIILPSDTPGIPTETPTPAPTDTSAQLPSVTPTSSELPTPCYRAFFVKDVTIPDYYDKLAPGEAFVKTWRLKNTGTCSWPADTQAVFLSGSQMGASSSVSIGAAVAVGEERDVSVNMVAPSASGTYTGYWMLKIPNGGRFGIGDAGNESFWVIVVIKSSVTSTPSVTKTVGTPLPTKTPTVTPTTTPTPTGSPTPIPTNTPTCVGGYPVC